LTNDFKNGLFKVREDIEMAHTESNMVIELVKTKVIPIGNGGRPNSVCVIALLTLIRTEGYDHQKMLMQLKKSFDDKFQFKSYQNVSSAVILLENIYNDWNEGKNRFRFISEEKKNKYLLKEARKQYSNKKQK
jgi:mannitol/fructose-specific phosphotransferase system IIA component (Ntr-type)